MITLEKAKNIAQEQAPEFSIAEVIDIGERWAFCFDMGETPVPGFPVITVDKADGMVGELPVPPIENLDLLENGKVVWKQLEE